jgi:hypothetical protein
LQEFRVTKYDLSYRVGMAYSRNEWTSFSDIGKSFEGTVLTHGEYLEVEDAYMAAALAFLREAGVVGLIVDGLENRAGVPLPLPKVRRSLCPR